MSDTETKIPLPDLENGGQIPAVDDAGSVTPPDAEAIPQGAADLEAVVLRCLAKEPAGRFPDVEALEQALAGCACAPARD